MLRQQDDRGNESFVALKRLTCGHVPILLARSQAQKNLRPKPPLQD